VLQRVAVHCTAFCSVLQCVVPVAVRGSSMTSPSTDELTFSCHLFCSSMLQRVAACCSVLQCVAVRYSVLQRVAVSAHAQLPPVLLQRVAACCSVLQRVAACCSVLQCVAVCCSVLQ